MATHARPTFAKSTDAAARRERAGGPRGRGPSGQRGAPERQAAQQPTGLARNGSHMPLDIDVHWRWDNPLNIIPGFMLLAIVSALLGLLIG